MGPHLIPRNLIFNICCRLKFHLQIEFRFVQLSGLNSGAGGPNSVRLAMDPLLVESFRCSMKTSTVAFTSCHK